MRKMTSILQHNCQKTVRLIEKGTRLNLQNDGTFYSFRVEETGELLAKNITRRARIQLDG